ncbi:DEAD/DEAH box helicase [Spiroplasma endosymbiont of Lasioglossum malachurum]|uniref:DEAD/DEAH box helicase n=1 Tax=Spiroplasma endosymbiont of Lasioglossum malachurum TaxID=3066319 RepID=UPI0030CC4836
MSFQQFNLQPWLIENLKKEKLINPTPVQTKIIPLALTNKNLIIKSATGSGKTHTYLIPILNNCNVTLKVTQAVIITPTRELAQQTFNFLKALIKDQNISIACLVGGKDIIRQSNNLSNNQPQIVIGTPTRLKCLYELNMLAITTTNTLVIDECDMLFDMGFMEDLDFLITKMNKNTQIMTFSATILPQLVTWLKKYITNATTISIDNKSQKIQHIFINRHHQDSKKQLQLLLTMFDPYLCLIFVNNKENIEEIANVLIEENKKVAILHGGLPARERSQTFKRIKNFEYQYVVCSDIAARGIDIEGVSHVISLQLPTNNLEYYFHRAGRTGRANYSGISYVFYDKSDNSTIHKLKNLNVPIEYYKIKDNKLLPEITNDNIIAHKRKIERNKEEQYVINRFKKNKNVTPGYKKKFNKDLEAIKKETRKQHIKASIKKIKKTQAIARRKKLFDEN